MRWRIPLVVVLVAFVAVSCDQQPPTAVSDDAAPLFAQGGHSAKQLICHLTDAPRLGTVKSISVNALPEHMAHGDCSAPEGTPGEACGCPIRIEADIDGRSHLILSPGSAQWHHYDYAAPGRLVEVDCGRPQMTLPTIIDGIEWYPEWPDVPTEENRNCNCLSDTYEGIERRIPPAALTPVLNSIQYRWLPAIVQQPTAANGYTTIIEFDDNGFSCADTYIVELSFR